MFERTFRELVWLKDHHISINILMDYEGKGNTPVQTWYNVYHVSLGHLLLDEVSWEEVVDFVPDAGTIPSFQKKSLGYDEEIKKSIDIVAKWDQGEVTISVFYYKQGEIVYLIP